jgi:RimJ/RimL family protein N-acetyltransferase
MNAMMPDLFRDDVLTLETPRLFLRWPKVEDVPVLAQLAGNRTLSEMTGIIPHPYSQDLAARYVGDARQWNAEGSKLKLAIVERQDPEQMIGMIGLRITQPDEASMGYWLGQRFWGRGYATEAAQALVDLGFMFTGLQQQVAAVRVINPASRRVLERCGFQPTGSDFLSLPAWNGAVPVETYRLTRSLWSSLKGWRTPVPQVRDAVRVPA